MLRFISHLFKLNYEECKGCEVLKNQLDISNHTNELLRNTLLDLVKPKVFEAPSVPIEPIKPKVVPWHARKEMLEEQSRNEAKIRQQHIDQLEKEVGLNNEETAKEG